jgi:outer membrane protein TolC
MKTTRNRIRFALALVVSLAAAGPAPAQAPHRLTLEEAIERGLASNLRVLAAGTRVDEAAGAIERRRANLLPRARAEGVASLQNRNLRAFGLSVPGIPPVVPPFSTYDMRFYAEQPLFDRQSYHAFQASQRQQQAAREEYQDIRDVIIRQVAGLYLSAQAAAARAEAAESRVTTAEELLRLARERRAAGVATGVDVLRAEVQLANEQQRLLEARNETEQALLLLARNIGLRPGTVLELAEPLRFQPVAPPDVQAAVAASATTRADYRALAVQRQALELQQKSSRARYLPKVSLGGDYGGIGRSFGEIRGTGALRGAVSVTLFDRDRKGEQMELESRLHRLDYQLADLQLGIEQEIREALLDLESSAQQVTVAEKGRELAQKELGLARERFQSGVANNVEITSAQDALARAMENHILAVTRHSDARMALARALGATEEIYRQYLGTEKEGQP